MIEHSTGPFEKDTSAALEPAESVKREVDVREGVRTDVATGALTVAIRRDLPGFTLDIAFSVPHGLTVLFGPSGSGKSLTLQSIAGLFPLDAAHIMQDEMVWQDSVTGINLPPQRRRVGYVPQNYALFPHLSVEQNIAFGLKTHGSQARQRVSELVDMMQLGGLERQRPAQLSGGQQQRVALARALAANSRLLLLDEPFSSLDAAVRETLREEMRAFHERVHVPIVLVTHDAAEARMLADTIVVIEQGHVLQVGTSDDVFRSPGTRAVASLVGMRTCWSGEVIEVTSISDPATPRPPDTHQGYPYISAFPPTHSQVATVRVNGGHEDSEYAGMPLVGIRGLGSGSDDRRGNLTLRVNIPNAMQIRIGQTLELGVRTDELHIFASDMHLPTFEGSNSPPDMMFASGEVLRDQPKGLVHSITVLLEKGQTLDIPMIAREMHALDIGVGMQVTVGITASAVHVFEN